MNSRLSASCLRKVVKFREILECEYMHMKKVILSITCLLLSLYIVEVTLRCLKFPEMFPDIYDFERNPFYVFIGLKRNVNILHETSEYKVPIHTDTFGCRSNNGCLDKKKQGSIRILILGDSFVFGQGVEYSSTFPKVLEDLINKGKTRKEFQVISCGVPGWTTYQELDFLNRNLLELNPDLIIISIMPKNDFSENGMTYDLWHNTNLSPSQTKRFPRLARMVRLPFDYYNRLLPLPFKLTRTGQLLMKSLWSSFLFKNAPLYSYNPLKTHGHSNEIREMKKEDRENILTLGLIDKLQRLSASNRTKITFMIANTRLGLDLDGDERERQVRGLLIDHFRTHEYMYIDLISEIERKHPSLVSLPHFPIDGHLIVYGHQIVADAIMGSGLFKNIIKHLDGSVNASLN